MTLNDLAKIIGVSTATVSLALNNKKGISEETRAKVLATAKEYGYEPTRAAPKKTKRKRICLGVYRKSDFDEGAPFFSVLIENIENEAVRNNYYLSISYLNEGSDPLELTKYDGLILLATVMSEEDILPYTRLNMPIVVLDNHFPNLDLNSVSINNQQGMSAACKYLVEQGHRNIGFVTSKSHLQNFNERLTGIGTSLEANGLRLRDIISVGEPPDKAYTDFKEWLKINKLQSTALIFANDSLALSVIRALKDNGIQPGSDIAVIGFDDLPFSSMADPPLTTIKVFNDVMGIMAVRRVIEISENPYLPGISTKIGTRLVLRESSNTKI